MQTKRKPPMRMCTGCGEMKEKSELVRIVKTSLAEDKSEEKGENEISKYEISIDLTGKKSGRGAYICKNALCLEKARKSRRLERAFGCRISDEIFALLEKELGKDA